METHIKDSLKSCQWQSAAAAVVGGVVCALVALREPEFVQRAYLYAFLTCWLLTMAGMGLLALGNLTGGRWAALARPFYRGAADLLPLMAILFVPIGLSLEIIYPWASATAAADHDMPASKAAYLEPTFFLWRAVGYFVVWLLLGWGLARVSRLDRAPADTPGMRRLGALALVLLVPTTTFAAFDWGMSLEPHWYSSIYGALLTAGGVLAVHALAIVSLLALPTRDRAAILAAADLLGDGGEADHREIAHSASGAAKPASEGAAKESLPGPAARQLTSVIHDLGNLQVAFLMVWAYFSFSQFLIIWAANLPSEITWYAARLSGGWKWLAIAVVLFHFVIPFGLLLSRDLKRAPGRLGRVAMLMIGMYAVNLFWVIVPAYHEPSGLWLVTNGAALVALGGLWGAIYSWRARRHARRARELAPTGPLGSQRGL